MKHKWNEKEIKKLLLTVEKAKDKNKPIQEAFVTFAKFSNRHPNSIRNFYYEFLENAKKDKNYSKDINFSKHLVNKPKFFSNEEANQLFDKINELTSKGLSVRQACFKLAEGNLKFMVRYQNKYRCILKEKGTNKPTVLKFPLKTQRLTDEDIKSLFLGLVKLVKQSAITDATNVLKTENDFKADTLRKALVEISQKNKKIADLVKQNKSLFSKNLELEQKLIQIRTLNLKRERQGQINVDL